MVFAGPKPKDRASDQPVTTARPEIRGAASKHQVKFQFGVAMAADNRELWPGAPSGTEEPGRDAEFNQAHGAHSLAEPQLTSLGTRLRGVAGDNIGESR